jgi:tartrate dehydratase beta subunit/fumarate hydratase class I family protein
MKQVSTFSDKNKCKSERERLTTSPTTAIRAEAAMEELVELLGLDEAKGEEPERQQRVGACTNKLNSLY